MIDHLDFKHTPTCEFDSCLTLAAVLQVSRCCDDSRYLCGVHRQQVRALHISQHYWTCWVCKVQHEVEPRLVTIKRRTP